MARFDLKPNVTFEIKMTLTEEETYALDAIINYDVDTFLTVFYGSIGETYLKQFEKGVKSLFQSRDSLTMQLTKIKNAKGCL